MNTVSICPHCYQPIARDESRPASFSNDAEGQADASVQSTGERCPTCFEAVIEVWEVGLSQQPVWIADAAKLPNVCVTCGMFTDRRVKVKHTAQELVTGNSLTSWTQVLGCVLGILLGPIFSIFTHWILGSDDSNASGSKNVKISMKIPQCMLCAGQAKAQALAASTPPHRLLIPAHHSFADRFAEINQQSEIYIG